MTAYLSLFRGLNVGGNHQVKMNALKALHESLGFADVLPYIQSGNVVFQSDDADVAAIQARIADAFATTFGFRSDVFVRTLAELQAIMASNPFQGQPEKASNRLLVMFLAARPDAAAQDALRESYAGPEEFFIIGQELYIYYPDGMGRSKFTGSFIEKKLKTTGTARNWNTVLQLEQMLRG